MIDASLRYARAVSYWHLGSASWADDAGGCETADEAAGVDPAFGRLLHGIANMDDVGKARSIALAEIGEEDFEVVLAVVDREDPSLAPAAEPERSALGGFIIAGEWGEHRVPEVNFVSLDAYGTIDGEYFDQVDSCDLSEEQESRGGDWFTFTDDFQTMVTPESVQASLLFAFLRGRSQAVSEDPEAALSEGEYRVELNLSRTHARALLRAAAVDRGEGVPESERANERLRTREAAAAIKHAWHDGSTARGRGVSMAGRVRADNGVHVALDVFVGRTKGSRGNCGSLMVRRDEWEAMIASGWDVIE